MAKKKPARPPAKRTPSKPPKARRGGGAASDGRASPHMDSASEKNFALSFDAALENTNASVVSNPVLERAERFHSKACGVLGDRHSWLYSFHEIKKRRGEYASTADVNALGMDLFRALSKLKHLAEHAYDEDARMVAGRILADLVNVWLDRWPDDAPRCVTDELARIREKVPGFQMRWDEINRRGRPRERGFAKKGEAERSKNEELLSHYIWNIQHAENGPIGVIAAHLVKGNRRAPANADHRVRRWYKFVQHVAAKPPTRLSRWVAGGGDESEDSPYIRSFLEKQHMSRMKTDEGWKAFCVDKFGSNASVASNWLCHAINSNFDTYWSMIIEPAIGKAHYLSWAKAQPFQYESDEGKTRRGIKGDSSRESPAYPLFAEAKRKMKPILQEIMHPAFRPIIIE